MASFLRAQRPCHGLWSARCPRGELHSPRQWHSQLPVQVHPQAAVGARGGLVGRGEISSRGRSGRLVHGQSARRGAGWTEAVRLRSGRADASSLSPQVSPSDSEEEQNTSGEESAIEEDDEEVDEELEQIRQSLGPEISRLAEEDWDEEELDELFEEFGETVAEAAASDAPQNGMPVPGSGKSGGAPPTDEESEALAVALAVAASDTKAGNIRVLDVRPLIYWTQYFVIATAFSRPQMDAMTKRMSDLAEKQQRSLRAAERMAPGPWTLLDYGDVVVHLFAPRERERYAIEEFYANAREVQLPFAQAEVKDY